MLYFTTETQRHGEKSIYQFTTHFRVCRRTENREPWTDNRLSSQLAFHVVTQMSLRTSMLEAIHSRAWIRLASVLKSETPCNS